ncbi:MAG: hypothetical protein NT151_07605 [Acidobacteria bacterium]|nr:hypothetical protein [Acidobacteriota bacterium]
MTYTYSSRGLLVLALLAILALVASAGGAAAQTVNQNDVLYIMPFSTVFPGNDAAAIAELRSRLAPDGEGSYVRVGFSVYIFLSMNDWTVDTSNPTAVRAAIADSIATIDSVVARGHAGGFPVSLAILDAVKANYDPVQRASEAEDIRSMQWYADNVLAPGWWSYSRYARKRYVVQQAYMREVAKEVARLMRDYPDTLVAASGDGEVELAEVRANPNSTDAYNQIFADYSPFTVAEFRDWIRHAGLYAPGGELAGQGYALGARYAGDLTPGDDTNGDGHTLNGDFGTSFTTWNLRYFGWSLDDQYLSNDPHAISLATYSSAGFNKFPADTPGGFDPPRTPRPIGANTWWDLWVTFKQSMIQRYNVEFAKWMTTSQADAATAYTIPRERWYSYQIPADYLFGRSAADPNERWYSSMSSWWTADISPYGSLGITAFNVDWIGNGDDLSYHVISRTLAVVAPKIAERNLRWGLIEWHPGVLKLDTGVSSDLELFRSEMTLIKKYRPSLLQPFMWGLPNSEVMGTPFETALRELVNDVKDGWPSVPFAGPSSGGPTSGTVSGTTLTYDGVAYPIVDGRVYFPDCTNYLVLANGLLIAGQTTSPCTTGGGSGTGGTGTGGTGTGGTGTGGAGTGGAGTGGSTFVGPGNGGPATGAVSGTTLTYNGATYTIVNGRVTFPDCTIYIALNSGFLIPAGTASECSSTGSVSSGGTGTGGTGTGGTGTSGTGTGGTGTGGTGTGGTGTGGTGTGGTGTGGSTFVGPGTGGPATGSVSGNTLTYNGATYTIVNGKVTFPDCTMYIALNMGILIPAGTASGCTSTGSVSSGGTGTGGTGTGGTGTGGTGTGGTGTGGSTFMGPGTGGPATGNTLTYNGATYTIVNGKVTFPDCTMYIALNMGILIPAGSASGCTSTGNGSTGGTGTGGTGTAGAGTGGAGTGGSTFVNPGNGGPRTGTVSGRTLTYNGVTYTIVDGKVKFPDCSVYIATDSGILIFSEVVTNCSWGGGA